jgi:hypothetical protein
MIGRELPPCSSPPLSRDLSFFFSGESVDDNKERRHTSLLQQFLDMFCLRLA